MILGSNFRIAVLICSVIYVSKVVLSGSNMRGVRLQPKSGRIVLSPIVVERMICRELLISTSASSMSTASPPLMKVGGKDQPLPRKAFGDLMNCSAAINLYSFTLLLFRTNLSLLSDHPPQLKL